MSPAITNVLGKGRGSAFNPRGVIRYRRGTISACRNNGLLVHAGAVSINWKISFQHPTSFQLIRGPVVQRLDNAIHRINRYPADKN